MPPCSCHFSARLAHRSVYGREMTAAAWRGWGTGSAEGLALQEPRLRTTLVVGVGGGVGVWLMARGSRPRAHGSDPKHHFPQIHGGHAEGLDVDPKRAKAKAPHAFPSVGEDAQEAFLFL